MNLYILSIAELSNNPINIPIEIWSSNRIRDRSNGPSVTFINGTKHWHKNGKLHREGGPASIFANGTKYWYLNDLRYTEDGHSAALMMRGLK